MATGSRRARLAIIKFAVNRLSHNRLSHDRLSHDRLAVNRAGPVTRLAVSHQLVASRGARQATLFVQLLPSEVGNQLSAAERRIQLEEYLFKEDNQFRMELQGVFGAFRPKCKSWSLNVAFNEFFKQKGDRWDGQRRSRLHSEKGREYVRLRLKEWCS